MAVVGQLRDGAKRFYIDILDAALVLDAAIRGLERLGHEVVYLEESGWPYSCYDPISREWQDFPHTGLRMARALMAEQGLKAPVCFVNRESGAVDGAEWGEVKAMLGAADLLLNVGGVCWLPEFRLCRRRAIVDMDPFFTQAAQFGAKVLEHDLVEQRLEFPVGPAEVEPPWPDVERAAERRLPCNLRCR